jgi:hypothetical protein
VLGALFNVFNAVTGRRVEFLRHERIWNSEIVKALLFPYCFFVNLFRCGDVAEFVLRKKG